MKKLIFILWLIPFVLSAQTKLTYKTSEVQSLLDKVDNVNGTIASTQNINDSLSARLSGAETGIALADSIGNAEGNYMTRKQAATLIHDSLDVLNITGTADSLRVLSSNPTTGNIYINSVDKKIHYKVGILWYRIAPLDSAYDFVSQYAAVYNAMESKPSLTVATAQNAMIKSLVDGGYWTGRMEVFYCFASSSASDALINWTNPGTYDATDGTGCSFTQYVGYDGDGSTNYFTSGWIPNTHAVNSSLNSMTIAGYTSTSGINALQTLMGDETNNAQLRFQPRYGGGINHYINSGISETPAVASSAGFSMVTRRSSTDVEVYKNGNSVGTYSETSGALSTRQIYLLADNNYGTAENFYSGVVQLLFIMNGVSDSDVTAINTIIETYMDALGIGVE